MAGKRGRSGPKRGNLNAAKNGSKLRLRGQGMPKLGGDGNGDLYAEVSVVVPTHLSEEERKLFERLHELRTPK